MKQINLQENLRKKFIKQGVKMVAPDTVFFSKDTKPLISSIATYIFINYMFEKADILYSQVSKENTQALRFNEYFKLEIYDEKDGFYNLILTKEKWQKEQKITSLLKYY